MATVYKEIVIDAPVAHAWNALRDFGAVHERLVPGFLTACKMDGDARVVTFFNGVTLREQLVGMDDGARRVAYTVVGGQAAHHNASAQVFEADGNRTRFVWITDVLSDETATFIGAMMDQGIAVIKKTLESS